MRVAHVITRMIVGGAQENTMLCCQDLREQFGDEVLLITGPTTGPEGSLMTDVHRRGIPYRVLPALRRAINPWDDTRAYWQIRQALAAYRPDVVHTHSAKGGTLGRLAASSLRVPAIVHTVHGAPFHPYQGRAARAFFRGCEKYAARHCHALISVADAMTELLVNAGVAPQNKFRTIFSGMEVEPFLEASRHRSSTRQELGYTDDEIVVGKVARLFHLKGHGFVIDAARQIVQAAPNVRFLFVGDGLLRDQLRQQINAVGLAGHFQFAGLVPPERMPALISAMDIVVHASLREGLARVLPQALLAEKPVVSFDIDGAREVVLPETTGFLVRPRDVDGLAAAVIQLAKSDRLRNDLGKEGRRQFTGRFRHRNMTVQVREVYERLLAGNPSN